MANLLTMFMIFFWAFLIVIFAIPTIISLAKAKKLFDQPNNRTIHIDPVPRLGGLAIFAGVLSSVTIFGIVSVGVQQLLAGIILIFFLGLKDDILPVSPFKKFFVQVLATGIVMFSSDIRLKSLYGFMGIFELEIGISYAFTFLAVVGISNAINLIDGLDGLAGSMVGGAAIVFSVVFFVSCGSIAIPFAFVATALVGSCFGFLRFNIYKATIFMGDAGSLVCGFIIAILSIKLIDFSVWGSSTPFMTIAILFVPLFDTVRVFVLRIYKGLSPFSPDRNHIHHRLLFFGFSNFQSLLLINIFQWSIVGISWLLLKVDFYYLVLFLISVSLVTSFYLEFNFLRKGGKV